MAKILVAGLNPAWQQVLVLSALKTGEVNRATESFGLAGGKGMNVAKILARAGHHVSLMHVLAGPNGDRMLDACTALGILSLHAFAEGETRAAITLVHEGTATEVIEPFQVREHYVAGPDSEETIEATLLDSIDPEIEYDAVLVCGTLPAGLDPAFYSRLLERVRARLILWDSVAAFTPEIARRIDWLKVNAAEYETLAPLLEQSGAKPSLLITDGPAKARVQHRQAGGEYRLPVLDSIVSPIGAGDTVTANLIDGLLRMESPVAAVVTHALACGMASCLSPLPAEWKPWDADRLEKAIMWEP